MSQKAVPGGVWPMARGSCRPTEACIILFWWLSMKVRSRALAHVDRFLLSSGRWNKSSLFSSTSTQARAFNGPRYLRAFTKACTFKKHVQDSYRKITGSESLLVKASTFKIAPKLWLKGTVEWDFLSYVISPKVPNWPPDSLSKAVLNIDSNSPRLLIS